MQIAGKIDQILQHKNYATLQNLMQSYDEKTVKLYMFQYGIRYPNRLICSTVAKHKNSNKIVTGCTKMSDVLMLQRSPNYDIVHIVPLAIIEQDDYDVEKFLEQYEPELIEKVGIIKPRRIIAKQPPVKDIKNSKTTLTKKQSQQPNNDKKTNTKQNIKKSKEILKSSQSFKENLKQKQVKIQPAATIGSKKELKVKQQSYSDDEWLKQYEIKPVKSQSTDDNMKPYQVKEEAKSQDNVKIEEECKIEAKVAELDIDDDDEAAFERLLAQKNKSKSQNHNVNLPNKVQNKTTQKIQTTTAQKCKPNPAPASVPQVKATGQTNLFAFMKKK